MNGTASATLNHARIASILSAPGSRRRRELDGEQRPTGEIVQRRGERARLCADAQHPEELEAVGGRTVRFHARRDAEELQLRPERRVELVRTERAGVERTRDELPERIELGERRPRRVVLVRGAV